MQISASLGALGGSLPPNHLQTYLRKPTEYGSGLGQADLPASLLNGAAGVLLDAGGLADQIPQVVELGAADFAPT